MIVRADTKEGIHNRLVDENGNTINATQFDTDNKLAVVLVIENGSPKFDIEKNEFITEVKYLPNATLIPA